METKERPWANEAGLSRRALLKAAPAALIAGAVPAQGMTMTVTPSPDTPVMALFREWRAHNEWLNGPATDGMPDVEFDDHCADDMAIIERMMLAPAQNAQDVCAKLIAVTDFGALISYAELEGAERVPAEARALIDAAA